MKKGILLHIQEDIKLYRGKEDRVGEEALHKFVWDTI